MKTRVSIIIPAANEAGALANLLNCLVRQDSNAEIIIADGGSSDNTVEIAADFKLAEVKVVRSERGRAIQMNAGARLATGDIFWFLHADCIPPEGSVEMITNALSDGNYVGGGFRWGLTGSKWYYKPFTALAHIKNKLKNNLFGDMGIFVRADVFNDLKGFAEIPFLEDVDFNKRLKRMGRIVILEDILYSSDRRLLSKGPMKTFIKNDIIKIAYGLGFSPEFLKKYY